MRNKCKGFTLVEALVSLALLGFLVVAVISLAIYVSEETASNRIEKSLHSVAVSCIETKRHVLQTVGSLPCEKEMNKGELGDIPYIIICDVNSLEYDGAYLLKIVVSAQTGDTVTNEVILYA